MKDVIVIMPGSFKPMHQGHINAIRQYANDPRVKEVQVFIGPGIRDGINQKLALIIAKKLFANEGLRKLCSDDVWRLYTKVKIHEIQYESPVLAAYKYIETAKPGTYALAGVEKGTDYKRVTKFVKDHAVDGKYFKTKPEGVNVIELDINAQPSLYQDRLDNLNGAIISGSILREDVIESNYYNFLTNYPAVDENTVHTIWHYLSGTIKK